MFAHESKTMMLPFLKKKKTSREKPNAAAALQDAVFAAIKPLLQEAAHLGPITPLIQVSAKGEAFIALEVDPKHGAALEGLRGRVEQAAGAIQGICSAHVVLTADQPPQGTAKPQAAPKAPSPTGDAVRLPHVKKIIFVASGKGGVGKSTVAVNLAHALVAQGRSVGLMDGDIYGPSQPRMLGVEGQKPDGQQGAITPLEAYGIKLMSIGLMVEADAALIWRGPIVQKALMQLLFDVHWGSEEAPLDYLLIDLPPGTGDIPLSLAQKIQIDGAVIVSTPQDIALLDVRRGIAMFEKLGIPLLGLVENMSTHICSQCGHEEHIFGHGGAQAEAQKLGVAFLGEVPLSASIRRDSDSGTPATLAEPYTQIAAALTRSI